MTTGLPRRLVRGASIVDVPENTRQITADMIRKSPMVYAAALCKTFGRVSHPPLDSKRSARLVSVGVSHYAEKVRWAFDILAATDTYAFDYVEDAHCPALAAIYTTSHARAIFEEVIAVCRGPHTQAVSAYLSSESEETP